MKYERKVLRYGIWTWMAVFFLGNLCSSGDKMTISAATESKKIRIELEDIVYQNNGGDTILSEQEDGTLSLSYDTTGEEEGYYTTFFFTNIDETVEDGSVISYHISCEQDVRMNVNLIPEGEGETYKVEEEEMVFIREDGSEKYEMIQVTYGTFKVPAGFSGDVFLPVQSGANIEVDGVGFIIVQEEDENTEFSMTTLEITDTFEVEDELFRSQFQIDGLTEVEIPVTGEYYYEYAVRLLEEETELGCVFTTENTYAGVIMDEAGKLYVSDEASADTIALLVEIQGILLYRFNIELTDSWLVKVEDTDVDDFIIPAAKDVDFVPEETSIPVLWIRGICLVGVFSFAAFYKTKIRKKG